MSDVSEHDESSSSKSSSESISSDSGEDNITVRGVQPYQDKPLANSSDEEEDELDEDGLSSTVLCSRFERQVPFDQWCKCGQCCTEQLQNPRECRCCHEVAEAVHKLIFDGSIEKFKCVTQHEDYAAMTNRTVLENVGPMLKDRNGRSYRRVVM
ncbi:uncharacterized protein LOC114541050 [Dendronephthya gigantea]|uniref:uncharacterized protein LOC114541050 n=1 Tax=Dendronephthya gigantea TaxID=151771 RepID=UPI00106B094A|nr:uncharacterized protein LOC114541050 [Dendronephthya gigantea]